MKKLFYLLLTLISISVSAQTSMHVLLKDGGHSVFYVNQIDSIKFIDDQAGASGNGTLASPYNVAGALKAASDLAVNQTINTVYIKGIVVKLQSAPLPQYGDASYYLSDTRIVTNRLYVYRGTSLGGDRFTADDEIKLGDTLVVCGDLFRYNELTIELTNSHIYSINGKTYSHNRKGDGTLENPFNAEAAAYYAQSLGSNVISENDVYIKGKIASIKNPYDTTYGNATFEISDDGTTNKTFLIYRALYLGNQKFQEGNTQIKEGDEVIIYGKVVNYAGIYPETVQVQAYLYSLNGVTEEDIPTPTPDPDPSTDVQTVTIADFNAAAESTSVWYQLTGTISNLKDGDLYGNFDLTDASGSVYVYGVLSEKGGAKKQFQNLVSQYGIANGTTITIIGNRGSYNGKIEVTNAYFVSVGK